MKNRAIGQNSGPVMIGNHLKFFLKKGKTAAECPFYSTRFSRIM
jgi:hypothetical protein